MGLGLRQVWFKYLGFASAVAGSASHVIALILLPLTYGAIKAEAVAATPAKLAGVATIAIDGFGAGPSIFTISSLQSWAASSLLAFLPWLPCLPQNPITLGLADASVCS
jgi:hypothetical protein